MAIKVIAVLAQKGGTGKSTLSRHWAVVAEQKMGQKVAIIDLDPQRTISKWYERRHQQHNLESPVVLRAAIADLGKAIAACEEEGFDLVFIDTPGKIESSLLAAAKEADVIAIPCAPTPDDIDGVTETLQVIRRIHRDEANSVLPISIFINQGAFKGDRNEAARKLLHQTFDVPVCPTAIARRTPLSDAFVDGRTILETNPHSKGAQEIVDSWKWLAKTLKIEQTAKKRSLKKHE